MYFMRILPLDICTKMVYTTSMTLTSIIFLAILFFGSLRAIQPGKVQKARKSRKLRFSGFDTRAAMVRGKNGRFIGKEFKSWAGMRKAHGMSY